MERDSSLIKSLFSDEISRNTVLKARVSNVLQLKNVRINIWRNTGIEAFLPIIESYLEFFNIKAEFSISSYDTSLDLRSWTMGNIDFIYLSAEEMSLDSINELLKSRITALYDLGSKNISVAIQFSNDFENSLSDLDFLRAEFPGVHFLEINRKNLSSSYSYEDKRLFPISANWLGIDAYSYFGRQIAMKSFLPYLITKVKLIAIDLDNTLYNGVLAEDGIKAIWQSEIQLKLAAWLRKQKRSGVMTAIVSRNEIEDVENLLESHPEWDELFDFKFASWQPKEKLIEELLLVTRISQDSVIFLDDSFFEIANVKNSYPNIQSVQYHDVPETVNFLEMYPGVNSAHVAISPGLDRASDLKSNIERESIFSIMSDKDAFKELRVELNFEKNVLSLVPRATELSNKTNQFNFAIRRLTDFEIRTFLDNPEAAIVLASLKDKYADSGFVSLICLNMSGKEILQVEEFCISCRALGRGLEDEIFFGSLLAVIQGYPSLDFKKIHISYREGDRNSPVIEWAQTRNWVIKSNYVEIPFKYFSTWNSQIK